MSYIRACFKTDLQVLTELLPSVKKDCGGCLPSALTFEESVQRFPKFKHKKNFVVSLLPCDHVESFHQQVLVDIWVLKSMKGLEESEVKQAAVNETRFDEEEQPLTIYLTHKLKNLKKLECYLVRAVTPIPIKSITIGALNIESFEWAKENLKDFLINSINNRLVIMKQNSNLGEMFIQCDLYEKLSMLLILECVPVMQGLVTAETMLVVSDIHRDELNKWNLKRLKSMQGSGKGLHLPLLKMPGTKPAQLTYSTIHMDEPDGGMMSIKEESCSNLLVSLLDFPFQTVMPPSFDYIVDVDNKIWITKATMTELQLNMGTWVRVSTTPLKKAVPYFDDGSPGSEAVTVPESVANQEVKFSKIKLAQVFPIEECQRMECVWQDQHAMIVHSHDHEFQNATAYVSPVFLFNILSSPLDDVKSVILSIERAEIRESPPCFANEVNISVIASPLTKVANMYDAILLKHFSTPRLVSTDDILCVYCDWKSLIIPNTQAVLDEGLPRNHILYFKVNKITGDDEESLSYFVDSTHSKLCQNNSKQSYVPIMAEHFVQNSDELKHERPSYWLTTHPGGLEDYVSKLENILKSLLLNCETIDVFPVLVSGPPGVGKKTVVMATSRRLHVQVVEVNCYEICGDTTAATEARLRNCSQKAFSSAPCILLLSNIHCLDKGKDANGKEPRIVTTLMLNLEEIQKVSTYPVLVLGTTSKLQSMTSDLRSCFLDEIEIQAPTQHNRVEMLQALSTGFLIGPGVSFKALASRTAGMVLADFCSLFSEAVIQAHEDVMSYCKGLSLLAEEPNPTSNDGSSYGEVNNGYQRKRVDLQKDICSAGILLHQYHFDKAISILQAAHSDSIGAPTIPNVSWQDIGGLSNVKEAILDTIQLPFQHPELFAAGLQRSGILLYGPPGTGKTLVAKAVATECSLNFLSVKGPELINMYVGQSEENVREIFATASMAAPCVIFFDELDSLAPNRGRSGDSGGVMDRVVSQLLAELDGIQKSRDVFVIGATNRPDLLDPALLRPGRFDTLLYLGITKEKEDRMKIMKALTRKFDLSKEINLEEVVEKCPGNLTGADFYALCSNALLNAIRRQIQEQITGPGKVELIQDDFELAMKNLVPSVSDEELVRFEQIRRKFTKDKQANKELEGELELDGKVAKR